MPLLFMILVTNENTHVGDFGFMGHDCLLLAVKANVNVLLVLGVKIPIHYSLDYSVLNKLCRFP